MDVPRQITAKTWPAVRRLLLDFLNDYEPHECQVLQVGEEAMEPESKKAFMNLCFHAKLSGLNYITLTGKLPEGATAGVWGRYKRGLVPLLQSPKGRTVVNIVTLTCGQDYYQLFNGWPSENLSKDYILMFMDVFIPKQLKNLNMNNILTADQVYGLYERMEEMEGDMFEDLETEQVNAFNKDVDEMSNEIIRDSSQQISPVTSKWHV